MTVLTQDTISFTENWASTAELIAETPALAASDTMRRKPRAATNPRLAARVRIRERIEVALDLSSHITFRAVCISPNTPDAVTTIINAPSPAAHQLDDLLFEAASTDSVKSAPC